jgi:hypothetical protein
VEREPLLSYVFVPLVIFGTACFAAEIVLSAVVPPQGWGVPWGVYIPAIGAAPALIYVVIVWAEDQVGLELVKLVRRTLVVGAWVAVFAWIVTVNGTAGIAKRCVNVAAMTVAATQDCQGKPPPGPTGTYAWYYGGSGSAEDSQGTPVTGGSFTAPGEEGGGTGGATGDDGEVGDGGDGGDGAGGSGGDGGGGGGE